MRYDVTLKEFQTEKTFGYKLSELELSSQSHVKIIVECNNCQKLIVREYRNLNRKHQCSVIDGNLKKCFKCNEWKDLNLFNKSNKNGSRAKLCRSCYNSHPSVKKHEIKRRQKRLSDINYYIKNRTYYLKNNANRKNIPYDLDYDYLINLWNEQNGLCYYTKTQMLHATKENNFQTWNSPSIDKKNPNLGYVKGNVVWCIFSVNSFKQSMTEEQFKEFTQTINWWWNKD